MKVTLPLLASSEASLESHRSKLLRYISGIVRDHAEAEDLLQEVMLRANQAQGELRSQGATSAWLFRISTNVALDFLRQRGRRLPLSEDSEQDAEMSDSDAPSLDSVLERAEMSACVQSFLDRLPDAYKLIVILHDLDGHTDLEIAELLALPLTTVKMRLHRARKALHQELQSGCSFDCDDRGVLLCEPKRDTG